MKKWFSYITSFAAILLFLVSSTGISFVIHHCSENNTNDFYLFANDYQCKKQKAESSCCCCEINHDNHSDNCTIIKAQKCCSNIKGYLKITDNYNTYSYQLSINPPIPSNINPTYIFDHIIYFNKYTSYYISPPNLLSGQDVLILNSQLLI